MTRVVNPQMSADERRFWRWADRNQSRPPEPHMSSHCWIWVGARTRRKQPMFSVGGRTVAAARWLYEIWDAPNGSIGPGQMLGRVCGVPMCIRPDHGEPRPRGSHPRRNKVSGVPSPAGPMNDEAGARSYDHAPAEPV